jgi:chromosome segregation ATPase
LVLSVATLQQELKTEGYPLGVYSEELGAAVVRLTEASQSRKAAVERVSVLEVELKGVKVALANARGELGEVMSRLEGLGEDSLKLGQDAEELAARVRRGEKEVEEKSASVAALEARCLAAKSWSKEQEEAREELERARDGAVGTLGDVRRSLGEARKKEGDLRDAVERLEEEKSALDAKVESERGAVEALVAATALAVRRKEAKERAVEAERGVLVALMADKVRLEGLVAGSGEQAASAAAALRRDRDTLERYIREVDRAGSRVKATPVPLSSPMLPNTMACTFTAVPHASGMRYLAR